MRDPNPLVLRRLLELRQFPLFADAELSELAVLAENVRETLLPEGAVIGEGHLPAIQLVIDGRIEIARADRMDAWRSREVFGALEVLASRELRTAAVAAVPTRTLQLGASDFFDVLEDNFGLLLSVLRRLSIRVVVRPDQLRPPSGLPLEAGSQLGLVERLIALRQHAPFATARLQALSILAHVSTEERWPAGRVIARAGDAAVGAFAVIEGTIRAGDGPGARVLGPGDAVGSVESIAGARHAATLEASSPVRALHTSSRALLDVIEDHTELGLSMIATFATALLDAAPIVTN